MKTLFQSVVMAVICAQSAPSQGAPRNVPMLQENHLLIVSVVRVTPSPWRGTTPPGSESRTLNVEFRLEKNLRGDLTTAPGATSVALLRQIRYGSGIIWDNPEIWSYHEVSPGQSWAITSESDAKDLGRLLEHPLSVEALNDPRAAEDIEFVVQNSNLPLGEQPAKLVAWLQHSAAERGPHIGEYAAALLEDSSSDSDVALQRAADGGVLETKLSREGQYALLVSLYQRTRSQPPLPDQAVKVLTSETMHYLFGGGPGPITKSQRNIIEDYLPWLVESPRMKSVLRETLTPTQRTRALVGLQAAAASSAISEQERHTLAKLKELLSDG